MVTSTADPHAARLADPALPPRYRAIAMTVVLLGTFMVVLDTSIVNVALPRIGADFGSISDVEWIVTAYLLAVGVSMTTTGWLADRFAKKRVFVVWRVVAGSRRRRAHAAGHGDDRRALPTPRAWPVHVLLQCRGPPRGRDGRHHHRQAMTPVGVVRPRSADTERRSCTEMLVIVVLLALGFLAVLAIVAIIHDAPRQADHRPSQPSHSPPGSGTGIHRRSEGTAERRLRERSFLGLSNPHHARSLSRSAAAPDDEALGVTRRQFFNRSILLGIGLGVTTFGASTLAFLWPAAANKRLRRKDPTSAASPTCRPQSRRNSPSSRLGQLPQPYPKADVAKAKKVAAYTPPILCVSGSRPVTLPRSPAGRPIR